MESAKLLNLKLANLIDTESYGFVARDIIGLECFKKCAILSHTWEGEEVTLRLYQEFVESMAGRLTDSLIDDIMEMDKNNTMSKLQHFATGNLTVGQLLSIIKILRFCRIARRDGYAYAWVDTCCIDKTDTTAMSKAFASMWDYYSQSARCYVYMSDVSADNIELGQRFEESRWFTRGWTLQELLASYKSMVFYDYRWRLIQPGRGVDLNTTIANCTNIDPCFLQHPDKACIAVKMSWLSGRVTTFDEDMAYCMLGIFGVQLQVNYREGGENAFRRLQMALIEDAKYKSDESIFAWTGIPEGPSIGNGLTACGLLAPWPSHFADCGTVRCIPDHKCKSQLRPAISAARDGVEIQIPVKNRHINNGADRNIAEAAKSNHKEILLNVQKGNPAEQIAQETADKSRIRALMRGKTKQNPLSNQIVVTLIKNPEKQWRRQPFNDQMFSESAKQSNNTMPLVIPFQGASDAEEELRKAKRGGFMDGMRAAIEARKRN